MAKYFTSRLIYFTSQRRVKIKPKSEISCHNTLTSVISGLFHTKYLHLVSRARPSCPSLCSGKKEGLGTLAALPGSGGMQSMKNPHDLSRK